jgi:hypothetical protein
MNVSSETELGQGNGATTESTAKIGTGDLRTTDRQFGLEKGDSPMSNILTEASNAPKTASESRQERRGQRRAGVKVHVRLRPADGRDEKFEEVLATQNASRANLYIISASRCYYKRMPLRVTFPFDSAHDSGSTSEETAEVVRLDHLPDGRVGVAILFRKPIATAPNKSNSTGKGTRERRIAIRHAVSAMAKLTDLDSKTDLEGRCSDLSVAGCYIDTLNPFPECSRVHLQLTNKLHTLEVKARVISHHIGMGMGLVFDGLGPEQTLVLVDWLSKRVAGPLLVVEEPSSTSTQPSATSGQSAPTGQSAPSAQSVSPEAPGSSDRALIVKLLQLLESNGNMTQAELAALLRDSASL